MPLSSRYSQITAPPAVSSRKRCVCPGMKTRSTPRRALVLLLCIASCAAPPKVSISPDVLAAAARSDPAQRLELMRQQGERLAHSPFRPGNRVKLLIGGGASFAALAQAIRSAHKRIDMESYAFDEVAGAEFAGLLLAARRRGVEVNLIYDAWGSLNTPSELFRRLRGGGVRVLEYNPLAPNARVPIKVNHRDHRKLLCVDGKIAITGGVNISRVYENPPAPPGEDASEQAWRDTDVRLQGPVVAQFEHYFMETWRAQKGPPIGEPPSAPPAFPNGFMVQAINGAPEDGQPLIYRTLIMAIDLSRTSVHLTTGFFVPTPDLMRVLKAAGGRGGDAQLIVSSRSNHPEQRNGG
jgi:cardiolipin synthase A/B